METKNKLYQKPKPNFNLILGFIHKNEPIDRNQANYYNECHLPIYENTNKKYY